jgi:hypothetical protein
LSKTEFVVAAKGLHILGPPECKSGPVRHCLVKLPDIKDKESLFSSYLCYMQTQTDTLGEANCR